MEIQIPASIRKDQIAVCGALQGCANSKPFVMEDQAAKVGGAMFRGFDWQAFGDNKTFVGQLVFTTDVPDDAPRADLNALFATEAPPAPKKVKEKNVDNN